MHWATGRHRALWWCMRAHCFTRHCSPAIDPGWHLYASQQPTGGPMPLVISIAKEDSTELMRVGEPHALYATDPQYRSADGLL